MRIREICTEQKGNDSKMNNENQDMQSQGFIASHARIVTIIAVVFGATSGIFGSLVDAPSMMIGFGRLTLALPFFGIPILMKEETRKQLFSVSRKDLLWCFITGAFLFGHFFSWFNAVKYTNVASASVLAALHPLVVLLVTVFFYKRKVPFKSVVAIIVALIGGAIITGADLSAFAGGQVKGNILAFLAGMFMGLYFAAGDEARKRISGSVYVFLVFVGCWVCFTIGMIGTQTPVFGYQTSDYVYIIIMTLVCQIGAHAVFNMCIGYVSSLYVSAWESAEPVFATILAVFVLGQIPTVYEIIGCVIVVGALLYYNRQCQDS